MLDGPGIESRGGARFSASVQSCPEAYPSSCKWVLGSFTGGKTSRSWRWPPTPSNAEVKGRVEVYLYSPSGPSWPGLGWTLSYFYLTENTVHDYKVLPIQGPHGLSHGSVTARLLGLWFWIPPGTCMSVSCEFYVLSGRYLCVGLIARREES